MSFNDSVRLSLNSRNNFAAIQIGVSFEILLPFGIEVFDDKNFLSIVTNIYGAISLFFLYPKRKFVCIPVLVYSPINMHFIKTNIYISIATKHAITRALL
jgi:hypothetical protein